MTRGANRRLAAAGKTIKAQPISQDGLDDMYSKFLSRGELPEDRTFAWPVLERALRARKAAGAYAFVLGYNDGTPREELFREAVHSSHVARNAARKLLELLVRAGFDPTDPEFVPSDYPPPESGSLAMNLLGWPDQLVRPEYEKQMERVLQQHSALRAQGTRSGLWFGEAAKALAAFLTRGEIPPEGELRAYALTVGEMFAIHFQYFGRGGEELLAAFDAVAMATDDQREVALLRLGQLQANPREEREHART